MNDLNKMNQNNNKKVVFADLPKDELINIIHTYQQENHSNIKVFLNKT